MQSKLHFFSQIKKLLYLWGKIIVNANLSNYLLFELITLTEKIKWKSKI
jgi:hypothetical protein